MTYSGSSIFAIYFLNMEKLMRSFHVAFVLSILWLGISNAIAASVEIPIGKRFCVEMAGAECISDAESGIEVGLIDDMHYKLYSDGSGVAEGMSQAGIESYIDNNMWHFECDRDTMSGKRICIAHFRDLWIQMSNQGQALVSVGTKHFPGSVTSLKVGKTRFDTMQRDGYFLRAQSSQIVSLLNKGTSTSTRFMKWPYRSWVEEEFEPFGVTGIIKILKWVSRTAK
jgi:hypothetical protein